MVAKQRGETEGPSPRQEPVVCYLLPNHPRAKRRPGRKPPATQDRLWFPKAHMPGQGTDSTCVYKQIGHLECSQ